jgi:hypothetical protein
MFPIVSQNEGPRQEGLGARDLHHAAAKALVRAGKLFTQDWAIALYIGSSRRARSLTNIVAWRNVLLKGSG